MRQTLALTLLLATLTPAPAWVSHSCTPRYYPNSMALSPLAASSPTEETELSKKDSLTVDLISKMRFRELQGELQGRQLDAQGTASQLRDRLRQLAVQSNGEECGVNGDHPSENDCEPQLDSSFVNFIDKSDPDFEYKELVREVSGKAEKGHWKAATRKLKKLVRRFGETHTIPAELYIKTLESCMANRLQGARASEPARKILDQMAEQGYIIPEAAGNYCIRNCLGDSGPDSTHQGFGGIDTALAMKTALDITGTPLQLETYEKMAVAFAREGSVAESMEWMRTMVSDKLETPTLATIADIAQALTKPDTIAKGGAEQLPTLLGYAKAAGYNLDSIASSEDGQKLLGSGVVAAEHLDNVALGLRLLTAAANAEGGDVLVIKSSQLAQRASTKLHQRAINRSVVDGQWKLAVKLLTLMLERTLRPSPSVWRNVVTCCAKAEKSKRATGLLLDWVRFHEEGKAEKPPISVFNTCMNTCEICGEEELTLVVLDSMKKTHDTEGNLITFNIALKRLAKQGNHRACEGIIVGMLQAGIEPSVVSYTTAVAACANKDNKQAAVAYEWIRRMRSRMVNPNVLTYNTALAACLDGSMGSTILASQLAKEMLADAERQMSDEASVYNEYTNALPDASTKFLARQVLEQLEKQPNMGDGTTDLSSIREPLEKLSEFETSETVRQRLEMAKKGNVVDKDDENQVLVTQQAEVDLEFTAASSAHRVAEV